MKKFIYFFILIATFSVCLSIQPVLVKAEDAGSTSFSRGLESTNGEVKLQTTGTVEERIGKVVGIVFGFSSIIFLIMIVYGGLLWMLASGNVASIKKARSTLIHAAIGLFVTLMAYQVASYVISKIAETTV